MVNTTIHRDSQDAKKTHNLGRLRLRHIDSNQIILIPTPSLDPNGLSNIHLRAVSWGRRIYAILTLELRSFELVKGIPLVHCNSRVGGHILL